MTRSSTLCVKNPYTGEILEELDYASSSEISKILDQSQAAFLQWKKSSSFERSQALEHAAALLLEKKQEFADLICAEAGKPIQMAAGEVDRAIGVLRWAAAEALRSAGELLRLDTQPTGRSGFGIHSRFPRGVVLGITPFNFPLNLVMHKVAPALASGCTIVIKPSPYTPLTALLLAQVFKTACPPSAVQIVLADDAATAQMTQDPRVSLITFTGSARVGWAIRKQAPEKPTTLELGGNAWAVVLEDTASELFPAIAKRIATAAFGYAGQSCISVQNVAVASSIWDKFYPHLQAATEKTYFGNPTSQTVITGPMIHAAAASRINEQLAHLPKKTICFTSSSFLDSQSLARPPNLIPPTLIELSSLEEATHDSALRNEELFAPLMTVQKFQSLETLISQINSGKYGLQTGVFTQNYANIHQLYQELEVGGLVVNDVPTTRYDHQPYGGVKESGQGREGLRYAMEEMTQSKFLALSSVVPQ